MLRADQTDFCSRDHRAIRIDDEADKSANTIRILAGQHERRQASHKR